ncbi:TPA: hypothetical protein N0F65_000784 [Lagenidium giganteum]|uniref:Fe2OG dioxygenase domain-containing protein n=1 Tax=Lagenidium giganteum TaxID=4803 RepID=A0AAV2ZCB6_9STRA|nr:TPA: hypothetical protein N0F65_000784 [Lagenidium giganteum]
MVFTRFLAAALVLAATGANAFKTMPVESFEFDTLQQQHGELLSALQATGIVSIKNIPSYAASRKDFLQAATECVNSPGAIESEGLVYRTLDDGTQRTTISTKSQVGNPDVSVPRVDCPEYTAKLREFSAVVDTAAVALAQALDASVGSGKESLTDIVQQAEHLDHFHQYVSPEVLPTDSNDEISLSMHTDSGLAILMTVPQFHRIDDGEKIVGMDDIVDGPAASAGLVIQLPGSDDKVQSLLHEEELIVMIGEGLQAWTSTGLDISPVLHGMQMPKFDEKHGQVGRSWFGKMLLMPKDRVMKNTGMTYETYANATTEYVAQQRRLIESDFSSVACPPHTRLLASDKTCTLKKCKPKRGSGVSKSECMKWCNVIHDADQCAASCTCSGSSNDQGLSCWMLCVPAKCPQGKQAVCDPNGAQAIVCQ